MRAMGRWWMLLLLVLCVPLKGMAAAGGLACLATPAGHSMLHGAAVSHGTMVANAGTHDLSAAEPCPGHEAPAAEDDAGTAHTCSACAPCCAAAAPAPEGLRAGAVPPLPVQVPHLRPLPRSVVFDVPHRPPR